MKSDIVEWFQNHIRIQGWVLENPYNKKLNNKNPKDNHQMIYKYKKKKKAIVIASISDRILGNVSKPWNNLENGKRIFQKPRNEESQRITRKPPTNKSLKITLSFSLERQRKMPRGENELFRWSTPPPTFVGSVKTFSRGVCFACGCHWNICCPANLAIKMNRFVLTVMAVHCFLMAAADIDHVITPTPSDILTDVEPEPGLTWPTPTLPPTLPPTPKVIRGLSA